MGNEQPRTRRFLINQYNVAYLDAENDEAPITDAVMTSVLTELADQAGLVEKSRRKIRERMQSGTYHTRQSDIYQITSSGIEYLKMMQKVVDAENTVVSNTNRINDFKRLITILADDSADAISTELYNNFHNMITAYDDVTKGMHKLDEDLETLANDLAFNHGSQAAQHLQKMLKDKAVPAFNTLLDQGPIIHELAHSTAFAERVARSQQGTDDLDANHAIDDKVSMIHRYRQTTAYVSRQMVAMSLSFEASSSAIDGSMDSIYLLFETILRAISLLSREFDHINKQTIDIKDLTGKIDQLMKRYQQLLVPEALPQHLAKDRDIEDPTDLLDATTMGPVQYTAVDRQRAVATEDDNPTVAPDTEIERDAEAGLKEFQALVMRDADTVVVDGDLNFQTQIARDEVARLYGAINYDRYSGFSAFGRAITNAKALPHTGQIQLHCRNERFSVYLPSGFSVEFEQRGEQK